MTACNCEEHLDAMHCQWDCPEHGHRAPNYKAIYDTEFVKTLTRMDELVADINKLTTEINRRAA